MVKGSFKSLWSMAVLLVGIVWVLLVFFIWNSGQLETAADRRVFLAVVIGGGFFTYILGFIIEALYKRKQVSG